MKRKVVIFWDICLAVSIAIFSCASSGEIGAFTAEPEGVEGLSLNEAVEQSAADITTKLPEKTRVAIVAFDSEHENLSNYIMDELAGALTDGSLEVADRRNLAYVYKELNFQMSGDVSDETAASIGKFLGTKYVITGQLVKAGELYRYRVSGISVETAVQESSTRLNVRNNRALQSLIADIRNNRTVTASAGYGKEQARSSTSTPKTAGAFLDRGILFASRGDFDMAIEDFTEAIQLDGKLASAYMLRGRAFYASASIVTSVEENFSSVTAATRYGSNTATQEQAYDRAIADFTEAIRLDGNNATIYRERGNAYDSKRDYDRAITDYTQAIRIDPNSDNAYYLRGRTYYLKGDQERAFADCSQAIRLNPNNAKAYVIRGIAYYRKEDYARARADWNKALQLDPNNATARRNLGALGDRGR